MEQAPPIEEGADCSNELAIMEPEILPPTDKLPEIVEAPEPCTDKLPATVASPLESRTGPKGANSALWPASVQMTEPSVVLPPLAVFQAGWAEAEIPGVVTSKTWPLSGEAIANCPAA